jgi:L,D-transpeptidase catalytic domain
MRMVRWTFGCLIAVALVGGMVLLAHPALMNRLLARLERASPRPTPPLLSLEDRLTLITPSATARLQPKFAAAGVAYPPEEVTLVGLKSDRRLQLYARGADQPWRLVHSYPVLAASGKAGPKLREGDRQVPEGIYDIDFLNPNSKFSVSMRVSYPNAFDRQMAAKEKRKNLGGAIMIHGRASSTGCLAMGDPAAEELFTLAAAIGMRNIKVIIAPVDLRQQKPPKIKNGPAWVNDLYAQIETALKPLPVN